MNVITLVPGTSSSVNATTLILKSHDKELLHQFGKPASVLPVTAIAKVFIGEHLCFPRVSKRFIFPDSSHHLQAAGSNTLSRFHCCTAEILVSTDLMASTRSTSRFFSFSFFVCLLPGRHEQAGVKGKLMQEQVPGLNSPFCPRCLSPSITRTNIYLCKRALAAASSVRSSRFNCRCLETAHRSRPLVREEGSEEGKGEGGRERQTALWDEALAIRQLYNRRVLQGAHLARPAIWLPPL